MLLLSCIGRLTRNEAFKVIVIMDIAYKVIKIHRDPQ